MIWNGGSPDFLGFLPATLLVAVVLAPAPLQPPVAKRQPHVTEIHGRRLVDDYHWLRDRDSPEVISHLEAENAYAEAVMAPTQALQERLYGELLGRLQEDDSTAPYPYDEFLYYSRTEKGKPFRIYCRKKKDSLEAPEEVILDLNALATAGGHDFIDLGNYEPSPDHRYLAYSYETTGDETFTLVVKDLASGELLPDRIENTYYYLAWASDSRTFFYAVLDAAKRPYKVFRHVLGVPEDVEVYHETDERFFVDLERSRSGEVILLTSSSSVTSEVRWLPAGRPDGEFRLLAPREHEIEYVVDHREDEFWILTNRGAKNFRVMRTPMEATDAQAWREFVPHRAEVRIETMDLFRDRMVLVERQDGLSHLRVVPFDGGADRRIPMPEPVYSLYGDINVEFDTPTYRFGYNSLVTPKTVLAYRAGSDALEVVKREPVLGGYDPAAYVTERLWTTVADGTRLPISIAYKKGVARDGRNPCLLTGYGAYGSSYDPDFSPHWVSLLDRGFVFAIAHIRGGGEMGEAWHENGRMRTKRNTFTDFIAAAEHLIAEGWTSSDRLAIRGTSAGGLLMGAVTTMRPDLFAVVVARVPFVDVINTMLDESLPLVAIEWEEWGDPREPEAFTTMFSYSPYDNVQARDYPDLLVTAGWNDPRVMYFEPAKWVAKLRAMGTGDGALLLKTNMGAGHSGEADRYQALRERAFEFAFVLSRLGIDS